MRNQKITAKTPEEAFDQQLLFEGYVIFLWVVMFLFGSVELFVGVMTQQVCVGVAAVLASLMIGLIMGPLLWEPDSNNRLMRRIRRAAYFPVRTKEFLFSKVRLAGQYGGMFWLVSLAAQVLGIPFFGAENIILYQGTLLAAGVVNIVFYLFVGTVGANFGE